MFHNLLLWDIPPNILKYFSDFQFSIFFVPKVISSGIQKSQNQKSPKSITKSPVRIHNWSYEEERALVEFIGVAKMDPKYGIAPTTQWPALRANHHFWKDTALHICESTSSSVVLTSECNDWSKIHVMSFIFFYIIACMTKFIAH